MNIDEIISIYRQTKTLPESSDILTKDLLDKICRQDEMLEIMKPRPLVVIYATQECNVCGSTTANDFTSFCEVLDCDKVLCENCHSKCELYFDKCWRCQKTFCKEHIRYTRNPYAYEEAYCKKCDVR